MLFWGLRATEAQGVGLGAHDLPLSWLLVVQPRALLALFCTLSAKFHNTTQRRVMSHPPSLLGSCCLVKAQLLRLHECVGHMPIIPLWSHSLLVIFRIFVS